MCRRLTGRVAIVTGAAQGIGEGIAMKVASEGGVVVGVDVNIEKVNGVAETITRQGGTAIAVKADVSNGSEVRKIVEASIDKFKKVDILVNVAGITRHSPIVSISEEDWDATLRVDLKAVMLCTQAVLPHMIEKRYGKIINISSISGIGHGRPGMAAYASAKAGVVELTKMTAREASPLGINANCICPGMIVTPITFTRRTKEEAQKFIEERKELACIRRTGTPEDIANAVIFLASDESSFITGQVLCVDGGRPDGM